MKSRSKVYGRKDRRIFKRTAMATNKKNIPGQVVQRGGIRL